METENITRLLKDILNDKQIYASKDLLKSVRKETYHKYAESINLKSAFNFYLFMLLIGTFITILYQNIISIFCIGSFIFVINKLSNELKKIETNEILIKKLNKLINS